MSARWTGTWAAAWRPSRATTPTTSPHQVGSERNGPDLSHEAGYHTDDWHQAHFDNPRYTRPQSFMPNFSYIKGHERLALIAYVQCLGGKDGVRRADQQRHLKDNLIKYYQKGPGENVAYLNSTFPSSWLTMPNPVPVTVGSVERGRILYLAYCAGCHGEHGDGRGPSKPYLNPPPMDFTLMQASGASTQGGQPGLPLQLPQERGVLDFQRRDLLRRPLRHSRQRDAAIQGAVGVRKDLGCRQLRRLGVHGLEIGAVQWPL